MIVPPQVKAILYGVALALIAGAMWWGYDTVFDRGYDACKAETAADAAKADDNNDQAASDAGTAMNKELGQALPAAQEKANASVDRIRTVYIDRPVAAECAWSGGVLAELDAGREAANRAVRGGAGSTDTNHPQVAR